ncbi:MAG: MerR family transcriptional regulator [Chloroflexota bacterium]|jgi:DNA-binding transcriptional MerR regulator|nr:MerR family transcriptional regulator [Chloroflexota bacterium]
MENDEQRTYSIGELADVAGVSTRTIRYYVSEGLLPPPVGSGPGSRYTEAHRQQLIAIARLKEQFLPLKEIRRRLIGHGAPPPHASVAESRPAPAPLREEHSISSLDEPAPFTGRSFRRTPAAPSADALGYVESRDIEDIPVAGARMYADAIEVPDFEAHLRPAALAPPPPAEAHTWRRVGITDEAELLITEDQYRRHQDRIDWLVQWAKRVLGS